MIQTQDISDTRLAGTRGNLYEIEYDSSISANDLYGTFPGELGGFSQDEADDLQVSSWYQIVAAATRSGGSEEENVYPLPDQPGIIFKTGSTFPRYPDEERITTVNLRVIKGTGDLISFDIPDAVEGKRYSGSIGSFPAENPTEVTSWQPLINDAISEADQDLGRTLTVTAVEAGSGSPPSAYILTIEVKIVLRGSIRFALKRGDRVKPFTLKKLCFALDVSLSSTLEKIDATTQCDDAKTYIVSDRPEITGSVNGYFVDGSNAQDRLLNKFWTIVTNENGTITRKEKSSTGVIHAMLSRKETKGSLGGYEQWMYIPMVVDSITTDKPASGMQTFNYNFTVVGGSKPHMYRHKIEEGANS